MTVSAFQRMIPIAWRGEGPQLGNEVREYEFHVGPGPDNKILIANVGGPTWDSWQVMEIKNGRQVDWTGDFRSAEEALASVVDLC